MFDWQANFVSICDAPMSPMPSTELDAGHPAIDFLHYWEGLNAGDTPKREQLRPQDIPTLLRWLMLFRFEKTATDEDYYLYLQGDSAATLTHGLHQGKFLSEFTTEACHESRLEVMDKVRTSGRPEFAGIHVSGAQAEYTADVTMGAFPFRCPEGQCELVMVPAPKALEHRVHL